MLTYLEDFLEYIGGYKTSKGQVTPNFPFCVANVRLANYDHNIVNTMGYQTYNGNPLTDKQYELAKKIVFKYRRQLQQKGIVVPEDLPLRMAIRHVDRSQTLSYDPKKSELLIKFPYNSLLVQSIRQFVSNSCGEIVFDREARVWIAAATVPNLVYLIHWAKTHNFEITFDYDHLLDQLYQEILIPELELTEEKSLIINNDPGSVELVPLFEHLNNPVKLLVHASEYQLLIGQKLLSYVEQHGVDQSWIDWSMKKKIQIDPTRYPIDNFLDWVDATNQYPVVWHSSDSLLEQKLISRHGTDSVQVLTGKKRPQANFKFYLIPVLGNNKSFFSKEEIAILVTSQSIIYNLKKHSSIQAKKIVYWGSDMLINK
jgi:hypothetical protein